MECISAAIREEKAGNASVLTSHFQMYVEEHRTALVNLKTGAVRIIPMQDSGGFADFERSVETITAAIAEFRFQSDKNQG